MRLAFATTIIIGLLSHTLAAYAEEFQISRGSFAGAIHDREPAPPIRPGVSVAPGPLWFFAEIRASEATLEHLRSEGRLPLQHRWYKNLPGDIAGDDVVPDFTWPLEEINETKVSGLAVEARRHGFYSYRTASCRANVPKGRWTAKVTDALGNSLPCDTGRCRYHVVVGAGGQQVPNQCPIDR